jgi:hypothetical protein
MGFLDRLFGGTPPPRRPDHEAAGATSADEQAVARYRYLLRTAPPEAIEQAHAEAFARLTPEQRAQVLQRLGENLPAGERLGDPRQSDPERLARLATRAEIRRPGTLERSLGGAGMGGMFAGGLLGTIAGTVIGTAIAHQMLGGLDAAAFDQVGPGSADAGSADVESADAESSGAEADADFGDAGDLGGGDFSGEV